MYYLNFLMHKIDYAIWKMILKKIIKIMKKIITLNLLCIFALFTYNIYGQVGIGTTVPNTNASLEINSANRGLLIPRLPLTNTLHYNTSTIIQ